MPPYISDVGKTKPRRLARATMVSRVGVEVKAWVGVGVGVEVEAGVEARVGVKVEVRVEAWVGVEVEAGVEE